MKPGSSEPGSNDKRRTDATRHVGAPDRETRRQILAAAEALFIEHGYKGASMKDVAEAVAITPAALYYHFPGGKEELFADTVSQFLRETLERAFQAVEPDRDFRERLTQLTRNVLSVPVDRLSPLLRDAHEYLKADKPELGREIARGYTARVAAIFQEAIDTGAIAAGIPAELLVTLHQGMCTALLSRRHFRGEAAAAGDDERLAKTVVAVFLDGVGRAPPAS
ncbi:MAG TPA: TetR/AcrR family transcriptional regulator [Ktedonobacterales bacterium]|jgi:AcrR family transcriptional regulator